VTVLPTATSDTGTATTRDSRLVACDESGSEGQKLVGGTTDVFAHASVDMDVEVAIACIDKVRAGTRSPATECKSGVVLRERNRHVLEWLIGPLGPLHGNAYVHLAEKSFHLVTTMVDLLCDLGVDHRRDRGRERRVDDVARTLYAEGPTRLGRGAWQHLLASFNDLMRAKDLAAARASAEAFSRVLDTFAVADPGSEFGRAVYLLGVGRPRCDSHLIHLITTSRLSGVLDPLVAAIVRAVDHWGADGRAVSIVHDEQGALTADRVERLKALCGRRPGTASDGSESPGPAMADRLVDIRCVDSQSDPRVQVADFMAGVARKIASDDLNGRGDLRLSALLQPFVDPGSTWGDADSWSRLSPVPTG
jgi:hypothetical protein